VKEWYSYTHGIYGGRRMVQEETKQIHIKMSAELHRKLRLKAAYDDVSIQECVLRILEKELDKKEIGIVEKGGKK